MVKFDIDKKGYDIEQVENYINVLSNKYEEKLAEQKDRVFTLRNEVNVLNERLKTYQEKDRQISKALIYAVEKADQIESSAHKLYDLEIKRVNILYERWNEIMELIEDRFGSGDGELVRKITEFKQGITSVLVQNSKIAKSNIKQDLKTNSNNYIKNLLNKMDYVINDNKGKEEKPKHIKESLQTTTQPSFNSINSRLKAINAKLGTKHTNLVDAYLEMPELEDENAFSKNIGKSKKDKYVSESGFDLQEALNPKEDLEEIMKAFDFFNN